MYIHIYIFDDDPDISPGGNVGRERRKGPRPTGETKHQNQKRRTQKPTREQKIQTDGGRKVSGRPTIITNYYILRVYVRSQDQHADTPADATEHKFASVPWYSRHHDC